MRGEADIAGEGRKRERRSVAKKFSEDGRGRDERVKHREVEVVEIGQAHPSPLEVIIRDEIGPNFVFSDR